MSHNYNQRKNRTSKTCFAQMRSETTGKIQKLRVLILDDGFYDGSLRFNQLQKWILLSSSGEDWVLLQSRATQALVFWMNSQVRSIVHCSSSILYVDLLPKMRLWVMEKAPSSLGFCSLFTNPSTNWWIWKIEIFMFCLVNSCTCFLSREQAAAWKTMRDNNAPCVFDFLEWIYKKLKPGRLCGKNLLPSL